jgi:DNA-binding IclR family transcriptional regulator
MKDVDIIITIPGALYAALDEQRKKALVPQPHPDNPEAHIMAPQFASVEAFVERMVEEQLAPLAERLGVAEPGVEAIKAAIAQKQKELAAALRPVKGVRRAEK